MPIREFDLVRWIRRRAPSGRGVRTGIGDDCAVLGPARDPLCLTTDVIVGGVDFTPDASPSSVGRKAVNVNLSDLAAAGARPLACLATLGLPPGLGAAWARGALRGVLAACRAAGASLVGGDLSATSGPAFVSVTALGTARKPVLRSGAREGDAIGVTGPCGGSILGRHLRFTPRIALGLRLAPVASAMIDISDGLAADLGHLLDASGAGARLESAAIPVHRDALRLARKSGRPALEHALRDGEDFELLFTCSPSRFPRWARRIGTVTRGKALTMDGRALPRDGYEHVLG